LVIISTQELGVAGVDIDIHCRSSPTLLRQDMIDSSKVNQQVGFTEQLCGLSSTASILRSGPGVDENPTVGQSKSRKKSLRKGEPVVVLRAYTVSPWIIGVGIVSGIFIEPNVMTESPQSKEVMGSLPRIAAKGTAHDVASEHDTRHL
jgi:hypothetical protein